MCEACQHPDRVDLDHDIRAGLGASPIAKKYGLRHHAVVLQHAKRHMGEIPATLRTIQYETQATETNIELTGVETSQTHGGLDIVQYEPTAPQAEPVLTGADEALEPAGLDIVESEPWLEALQPGLPHVRRARGMIKDRQNYERLIAILNDAVESENLGL